MRQLVVVTRMTLDGVMEAPGGPENFAGGFEWVGWSVGHWDAVLEREFGDAMARPFDLLLGRRTYEILATHWTDADGQVAERLNGASKHVASKTLERLEWTNSSLIDGDVASAVRALKAKPGPELQVLGSCELIQTLLADELVDEFRVWIFPVVAGRGKRLFGDGTVATALALVDSRASTSGVIIATYRSAGPIRPGSFAVEEPTQPELGRRRRSQRPV